MANGAVNNMAAQTGLMKKIGWTFLLLCCYRIGVHVPIPGVDAGALASFFAQMSGTLFGLFDMFSGGGCPTLQSLLLALCPTFRPPLSCSSCR